MAQNNQALLVRLKQKGLPFVVIGGVCCVYYGVPIATFDLEICCPFDEPNLMRIEAAVRDLHPFHRLAANKLPLDLTPDLCSRLKNLYLQTDLGKLDCLGEVAGVGSYQDALQHSVLATFSYGQFRYLNVDALIRAKEAADRDQDRAALKHLRPIREKLRQRARDSLPGI